MTSSIQEAQGGDDYYQMMSFFAMATANLSGMGKGRGKKNMKFPMKVCMSFMISRLGRAAGGYM